MQPNALNNQDEFRNLIDLYLTKWKFILLVFLLSMACAYLYLRYSTNVYEATATIKIKDEKNSNKLSEISTIQNYGMFSTDFSKVEDEIQIIKSKTLVEQVVKDLKLNISYFVKGQIKDKEVYTNPPLNLNFFASDSIISQIDTTLYVKIKSANQFELSNENPKDIIDFSSSNATEHAFGDKIATGFGDFIITPNLPLYGTKIGSVVKIKLTPINEVVESYVSKLNVQTNINSSILNISIRESVKDKAKLILNKLIEKYNQDAVNDKEEVVKITSEFINNRLDIVSRELEQVDLTAENLKKNNRLSDLGSQSSIFLQSEKENEAKLVATTNQIQLVDYMADYLSENNGESDLLPANVGIADNGVSQLTKSHNELVLQRNRLLKNSSEKNPTIINLNNQIRALKDNLNQSLQNIKSSNEITLQSLNKEDARISSQIFAAPKKERQFRDISRQQSIKESLYLYLLQKREETAITLGMSSPNAKIIDAAFANSTPVKPKRLFVYLSAFILGLLIPIALIYARDLLDSKIHSKADIVKRVKAPFIGDIPKSSSKKKNRLISKVDYSPKAEAFRMLRTNIAFMFQDKSDKGAKTIFVTSTTSQEGKSHTSVNLAMTLSYSNKKVLLIETDIRVPRVEDYLSVSGKKGLTDFISDNSLKVSDAIISIKDNKFLDIIPSGTIPPNPAELLMSDRVKSLFEEVKAEYDYIVVDTAAVGLVTDTLLISKYADMFLYVVSANNLDKRQLHVAQTMYEENRLPNMSILLNGSSKKNGYGYGYGYGTNPNKKKWYQFS
jgi:capsular exopolysaccharide synthesis family protein